MRKLLYLGFCLVLVSGFGCAITNYGTITDNNQSNTASGVINTNGKAHINETSQIATIWPDGTDELINFVDQAGDGTAVLTTYNNFSTGSEPTFHDDLYCNPDWQGCAIVTAPDPEVGDSDIFDGSANANCLGFRSLSVSLSTGRYYGECGRARLDLSDRLSLANMGRLATVAGREGLLYDLNRNNFSIIVDNNAGVATSLPITGDYSVFFSTGNRSQALVDLTNPLGANVGRAFSDFLRTYGTAETDVTITYNGISSTFEVGGDRLNASNVLGFVNRKF
jgi:hypothetical protein